MPLDGEKVGDGDPLTRIEKKVIEIKYFIHRIQFSLKLKAAMMPNI
jgi:hypothetical protein